MRLFFAIELPAELQALLGRLRPADAGGYRWVDSGLLHVTLVFLGQQPDERLEVLQQASSAAAAAVQPGVLKLGRAGSFGSRKAPSVLWMDLGGDVEALVELHARLAGELRSAGVSLQEDRPFRPHITLARRRPSAPPGAPPPWPPSDNPASPAFALRAMTLFESRLSPRGPTYLPLFQSRLGASRPG